MSLGKTNNRFSFDRDDTFEVVDEVQLLHLPSRHFSRAGSVIGGSVIGSTVDRRSQYMKRSVINAIASAATQTEHSNAEQACQTQVAAETSHTQTEACTAATCTKTDQALQVQVDVSSIEAQTKDKTTLSTEAQTESPENPKIPEANSEAILVQAMTRSSVSESTQTAFLQTSQATQSSQLVRLLAKHTQTFSEVPPLTLQDLATECETASARTLQEQSCQTQLDRDSKQTQSSAVICEICRNRKDSIFKAQWSQTERCEPQINGEELAYTSRSTDFSRSTCHQD